jgi:cellobiose phosphorylase
MKIRASLDNDQLPAGAAMPSVIRHGAGYSIFEQQSHGLKQHLSVFAVPDAPVKIVRLRLENLWTRPRRITATYYAEWLLGTRDITSSTSCQSSKPAFMLYWR